MASGPQVAVGQVNTYIKDHNATGKMIIGFSRNPKDFGLANYAQIKSVTKESGYYLQLDQFNAMRLVGGSIDEFVWPDGSPRPVLNNNGLEFRYLDYRTVRRDFGQPIGQKSIDQADWDVSGAQEQQLSQKAMTARTRQAHAALALAGNWDTSHRVDVTAIPGVTGQWSGALSTNAWIRRSINYAIKQIKLDTGAKVKEDDMLLVLNPTSAYMISQTQELLDHLKQSPVAYEQVRGGTGKFSSYGLPDKLFGLKIHVEDAVMVTSPKGAATVTNSFIMGDGIAYILSRPGGIEAPVGGPTFSTVTTFALEEMTVEKKVDTDNRRTEMHVVDDTITLVTAPVSGFSFLNIGT